MKSAAGKAVPSIVISPDVSPIVVSSAGNHCSTLTCAADPPVPNFAFSDRRVSGENNRTATRRLFEFVCLHVTSSSSKGTLIRERRSSMLSCVVFAFDVLTEFEVFPVAFEFADGADEQPKNAVWRTMTAHIVILVGRSIW